MQIANTGQEAIPNGHGVNRWSIQSKFIIGAGVITLLALAIMAASNAYTRYENWNIKSINCGDHEFSYFNHLGSKNGASAPDQYCLAEMLEKGIGTKQSLSEARYWYKKAYSQGLRLAVDRLCQPYMFEQKWGNFQEYDQFQDIFNEYAQFKSICCPSPPPGTVCEIPTCPWQKGYDPNQTC